MKLEDEMEKTKQILETYRDNLAIFVSHGQREKFIEEEVGKHREIYKRTYSLDEVMEDRIDEEIRHLNATISTLDFHLNKKTNAKSK